MTNGAVRTGVAPVVAMARRVVRVCVDIQVLDQWLRTKNSGHGEVLKFESDLPEDAKLLHSGISPGQYGIDLYYEHHSFDEVQPGHEAPLLNVNMRAVYYEIISSDAMEYVGPFLNGMMRLYDPIPVKELDK